MQACAGSFNIAIMSCDCLSATTALICLCNTIPAVMAAFEHTIESSVQGFHVHKAIWTPTVKEQLKTRQKHNNAENEFAVAVYEDDPNPGETVGHVPKEMSRIFWHFL